MILTIKTDTPVLELSLIDTDSRHMHEKTIELGRLMARNILSEIKLLLTDAKQEWSGISGIIVFTGPGSFTGLRIGITVANAIAHAEAVPVVGVNGEEWYKNGLQRLKNGENDKMVTPEYGKLAHITQPRK